MMIEDNNAVNQQPIGQSEVVSISFSSKEAAEVLRQEDGRGEHSYTAQLETANQQLREANLQLAEQAALNLKQLRMLEQQKANLERANQRLKVLNSHLAAQAITDGLTGLINHRTFHERLCEEIERAVRYTIPLSLLFMDVDEFKAYNDLYGHLSGDAVLRNIGTVLQASRRTNDLIARYGGEEFAAILPETDAEGAVLAAERFRAAIEATRWQPRQITVSVGVATLSHVVRKPSALIDEADKALYYSKERGRNCVTHCKNVSYDTNLYRGQADGL